MVCMSPSVTSPLIDKLAKEYDAEVLLWTNELSNNVQVCYVIIIYVCVCIAQKYHCMVTLSNTKF